MRFRLEQYTHPEDRLPPTVDGGCRDLGAFLCAHRGYLIEFFKWVSVTSGGAFLRCLRPFPLGSLPREEWDHLPQFRALQESLHQAVREALPQKTDQWHAWERVRGRLLEVAALNLVVSRWGSAQVEHGAQVFVEEQLVKCNSRKSVDVAGLEWQGDRAILELYECKMSIDGLMKRESWDYLGVLVEVIDRGRLPEDRAQVVAVTASTQVSVDAELEGHPHTFTVLSREQLAQVGVA